MSKWKLKQIAVLVGLLRNFGFFGLSWNDSHLAYRTGQTFSCNVILFKFAISVLGAFGAHVRRVSVPLTLREIESVLQRMRFFINSLLS